MSDEETVEKQTGEGDIIKVKNYYTMGHIRNQKTNQFLHEIDEYLKTTPVDRLPRKRMGQCERKPKPNQRNEKFLVESLLDF